MSICKYVIKLRTPTCILNKRCFSALSNNKTNNDVNLFTEKAYPCVNIRPGVRYFSLEGFSKWQEGIYSSISNSYPVHVVQDGLLYYHDTTGLPWWATVVTSTILIRSLMTFPLSVYSTYVLAKVENISLELKDLVLDLKRETAIAKRYYGLSEKQAALLYKKSLKKQWVNLIERDNCHPFKASLVVWFQIPVWVCMSFALRNMVYMASGDPSAMVTFMELSTGGIGWIPNLTEPDHSWILPVAFGLTNLSIIEIQRMSKLRQPSKMYNIFTNVFRAFSIIMIPVAASVPSCMILYWMTSSSVGLIQNLVLLSPSLRRKLKIPVAPSEIEEPYKHIKQETPIIASIYTSGRDEQNFSQAAMFLPYRWDRNDPRKKQLKNHEPSASLPFALGARSCIGKKIAMLQISELIYQIVNQFDLKCLNQSEVKPITTQVLVPDKDLKIAVSLRKYNK